MKNRIPDGDPVLALDDAEHKLLCAFCEEYAKRNDLPHTTLETHTPLAALLCYLRESQTPDPDYTGKVIQWAAGGRRAIADCIRQERSICHTPIGAVHVTRATEHFPGSSYTINWPPRRR